MADRIDVRAGLAHVGAHTARLIQVVLLIRLVLLFFAAPSANPIVRLVLAVTDPIVGPFRILAPSPIAIPYSPSVLDPADLIALLAITLGEAIAWLIGHLVQGSRRPLPLPPSPVVRPADILWGASVAAEVRPVSVSPVIARVSRIRER